MFQSVFEGFESFLFVPNTTSRSGVHIHDSIDSKRTMIVVIIALLPAMLFGMYNVGYQHYLSIGELARTSFWSIFFFGFLAVLPKIVVAYVVGLGIEFTAAQIRHYGGIGRNNFYKRIQIFEVDVQNLSVLLVVVCCNFL